MAAFVNAHRHLDESVPQMTERIDYAVRCIDRNELVSLRLGMISLCLISSLHLQAIRQEEGKRNTRENTDYPLMILLFLLDKELDGGEMDIRLRLPS